MKNRSKVIITENNKHKSRLIKAIQAVDFEGYSKNPDGVWGCTAIIECNGKKIKSTDLDLDFDIPFDDNLEADEGEIVIYNLAQSSLNAFTVDSTITISAGYNNDIGLIFKGTVQKVSTKREGADRVTTIRVIDDIIKKTVDKTYDANTRAQTILEELLKEAAGEEGYTFEPKRDYEYENSSTLEGELETEIKRYSDVCGVSTFKVNGKIHSISIDSSTNISDEVFPLSEETGLIGSPEPFEELVTTEGYEDTYKGVEAEMLLNHRITVAMQIKLDSEQHKGTYTVKSGRHSFDGAACTTHIKAVQEVSSVKIEKEEEGE